MGASLAFSAEAAKEKTERKNITLITAQGTAEGSSEISREPVKECIVTLPTVEALEPDVISDSRYLKEVNGETGKNEWTKTGVAPSRFSATGNPPACSAPAVGLPQRSQLGAAVALRTGGITVNQAGMLNGFITSPPGWILL